MLPILLAMGVVALIWGFVLIRKGGLIGGCLATIGTGACLGYPFFHMSVITLDRLLLVVISGLYVSYRNFHGLTARPLDKRDIVLVGFLGLLTLNVFNNNWRMEGAQPLATLLFFHVCPFLVYWIASRCELHERSHRWVIGFFAVLGVYLAITAVGEVKGISAIVFPKYILSPGEFLGRARGPFLNPIGNGMYLIAAMCCTLMWWPFVRVSHRPILFVICGALGIGIIGTLTRSVWLGAALAMATMAIVIVPNRHRLRVVLVFVLLGSGGLMAKGSSLTRFKRDKNVSVEDMAQSAKLRPILAAYAYEMFFDRPILGCGLGHYKNYNLQYLTSRSFNVPMDKAKTYIQHNVFLSLVVETGLVGLGLFLLVLSLWMADGWSLWHTTELPIWQRQFGLLLLLLVVAYLPNAMFHELSVVPMLNMLMFFVAGLARNARSKRLVAAS